jgi:hypothetical protein
MTKKEREVLMDCIEDIRNSDDQIDPLTRLFETVKELLKV